MDFVHNLFVIVIPNGTTQLVIVHVGFSLPDAPEHGYSFRVKELELSIVANPSDDVRVLLFLKELVEKLPKLNLT